MGRKISALFLSVLLTLLSVLPVTAAEATNTSVSVVSACWTEGKFTAYVHPQSGCDTSIAETGVMINNNTGKSRGKLQTLAESGQPVRYMLLLDLSTSMPQYKKRILAFAEALAQGETREYQITVGGFGERFEILEENLSSAEAVQTFFNTITYEHRATDIGGGVVEALKYLSGKYKAGKGPMNLVVLSDGVPYLSGNYESEEAGIRETSRMAAEAIANTPEISLHTVSFSEWDATIMGAVSTGSGLDVSAYSVQGAKSAAQQIAEYTDSLFLTQIPFSWDFDSDRMDLQLMISDPASMDMSLAPIHNVANIDRIEDMDLSKTPEITIIEEEPEAEGDKSDEDSEEIEEEEETEEVVEEPKDKKEDSKEKKETGISKKLLVPICAAAALLLAVIVFMIVRASRSRKKTGVNDSNAGITMRLEVISGNVKNSNENFILRDQIIIGSSSSCDLVFKETDIAPKNSRIFMQDQLIFIENINEKENNTCIGGMKIYAPNRLRSGDEISIGSVRFIFRF